MRALQPQAACQSAQKYGRYSFPRGLDGLLGPRLLHARPALHRPLRIHAAAPLIAAGVNVAARALPRLVQVAAPLAARLAPRLAPPQIAILAGLGWLAMAAYFAHLHQKQRQEHASLRDASSRGNSSSSYGDGDPRIAAAAAAAAAAAGPVRMEDAGQAAANAANGGEVCKVCGGSGYVELEYKLK